MKKNKKKKVYKILASQLTIIFYWVIFPLFLFWFSFSASFLSRLFQLNPPDKLITTGIYAKSRNPMFFGYTVILIRMGILLRSVSILVIFVPAFTVFDFIWIKLEEKNIREKFCNKYANYQKNTPFFILNHLF